MSGWAWALTPLEWRMALMHIIQGHEPRLDTILNFPITLVTGALHLARIWTIKVTFLTMYHVDKLTLDNLTANHLF